MNFIVVLLLFLYIVYYSPLNLLDIGIKTIIIIMSSMLSISIPEI